MWLWVIIVVAGIGAIVGFFMSKDGDRGGGAMSGAAAGGCMAASCIARIFIFVASIALIIWLFRFLFC